jgi:hypothetical protein
VPSHQNLPSIQDHLDAYGAEVNALRRPFADTRRGAGHDVFGGTSAVLFVREATRARDLFRAIYFDSASGDDVDVLLFDRYGETRVGATKGQGQAVITRPAPSASGGSFLVGTRILVTTVGGPARFVEVATETPYAAADVTCVVPIQNVTAGTAAPLQADASSAFMRFEDPVDDATWAPNTLAVASGTDRERDADAKARVKADRLSHRVGYVKSITDACVAVGAGQVVLFASDSLNEAADYGINRCFVGFSSYVSTPELVRDCRIAVDSARVLGADLVVMGMDVQFVNVQITVRLWLPPSYRNQVAIQGAATAAVVEYFNNSKNAFAWRLSAIRGAILRAMRTDAQSVDVHVGIPGGFTYDEPELTTTTYAASISRYYTTPEDILVTVLGPQ